MLFPTLIRSVTAAASMTVCLLIRSATANAQTTVSIQREFIDESGIAIAGVEIFSRVPELYRYAALKLTVKEFLP